MKLQSRSNISYYSYHNMRSLFSRLLLPVLAFLAFFPYARADEPNISPLWTNLMPIVPRAKSIHEVQPSTLTSIQSLQAVSTEATIISPSMEVVALAEALGNDPIRIFNHVRNQIDYEHYYGVRKAADLTMIEGSGNDADQCTLLAALLNAAGYTDVKFCSAKQAVYYSGNNGKNLEEWMGLAAEPYPGQTYDEVFPDDPLGGDFASASDLTKKQYCQAYKFLATRGSPYPSYEPVNLGAIYFDRVWLELTIDGIAYKLDPAFKRYERIAGASELTSGLYNRSAYLTAAGGSTGAGYVQSLNASNIANQLTSLTAAILGKIQTNYPNATIQEVVNGRRIIKENITDLSQAFPLGAVFMGWEVSWSTIPDSLKSKVQFVSGSLNYTIPTSDLGGRRISLSFDGNNIRLWLDDTEVATTANSAATFPLQITVTHPGGQIPAFSETKTYKKNNAFSYAIIYGFNASGKQLQKRYKILNDYLDNGKADDSREVRSELLNIMGLTWLYQTELASRLIASNNNVLNISHHRFGRMAQEEGFYVDVGLQLSGAMQDDGNFGERYANVFHLGALFASALEHGIIEQMQPGTSAVSTVNIIRKANTGGQRLYLTDSTNWSGTVRGQLQNYSSSLLTELDNRIAAGAKLFLPRNATVSQGSWTGTGYIIRHHAEAGMIISGNYSGGYSTSYGYVSSPSISLSSLSNPTYTYCSPALPNIPTPPPSLFTPTFHGSDPVDMATGAFVYSNTDLETGVSPAPEGLDFSRHYSTLSVGKDSQNLGYGWSHNLHLRAVVRTATEESLGLGTPQQATAFIASYLVAADLYREDASAKEWAVAALTVGWYLDRMKDNAVSVTVGHQSFQFIKQPDGSYTPPAGSTMSLTLVSGKYELRQRLGNVIKFDSEGKGLSITDPDNRTLTFIYNGDDTLKYIQDAYGRRLTFTYTTTTPKRITRVTDSTDSRYVEFRYDTSGNLDRFTDPEGKYSYYDYVLTGDPTGTVDLHQIRRLRNHDDQTITTNVYDVLGRVSEQYLQGDTNKTFKLRYAGYANTEENPAGGVTTYFYDERGRATGTLDASGKENRWTYNGQDQIATRITPTGETTVYHYDGYNNLVQIDHPRGGGSTHHVYDSLGRLDLSTDPEGNQTDYVYFTSGTDSTKDRPYKIIDPVGTTTFQYYTSGTGAIGKLWKSTDGQGLVTEYAYDSYGQPDWIKAPGGFKTDYQYTSRGDLDYEDDPNLIRTDYTYNKRRQVTQIVSNYGGPDAATEDFSYDNEGMLQTTTAPAHNGGMRVQTKQTYSPTEQLRFTYLVNDTATTDDDLIAETRYDGRDWPEKSFDASARETSVEYLPNGKVWKTNVPLSRQGVTTYDDDGRPESESVPGSPAARTLGYDYSVTATADGNQTNGYPRTIFTDADALTTTTEYDRLGQVRYVTNKRDETFEFRYDGLGRQTHVITPLDAVNGRAHVVAYNHRGAPTLITEPSGQTATYTYTPVTGRLSSVAYSNGTTTETVNYTLYDNNGNLKTVTEGAQTLQRTYDNLDRTKTSTDANGQQLQYRYYPSGALKMLIYPGGNDTTTGHVEYTYYQTGRLKEVIDRLDAPAVVRTTTYYWNNDGRMARVVRPNGTERRITYDAAGRPELVEEFVTSVNGSPKLISAYKNGYYPSDEVQWTYALPKPHPATSAPAAVTSMTYRADNSLDTFEGQTVVSDPDGNMTTGPLPDGSFGTYGYDIRNRLQTVGGVSYGYDPESNRTSVTDASGTTTYVVETNLGVSKVLARTKGGQTTRYVWGAGLLYEVDASGNAVYYHYDQVGSTTALTDDAAQVIERIEYAPFGWITYRSNVSGTPHDTPFLYTGFFGNQTDSNGLIYMRARYYNPLTRRFLNSDPAREGGNWFAYAAGNPLAFIDPTGLGINSALDSTQTVLSFLGLVPVVGEVFDVVNAGISLARGNYGDAALNLASALPGLGNAIGGAKVATASIGLIGVVSRVERAEVKLISAATAAKNRLVPEIGRKLDYVLGRATGSAHNVERSTQMLKQLESVGLHDTAATRQLLGSHLDDVLNNSSNILRTQANGRVVRESLLMGPNGGVKLESVWDGTKLITVNVFGGKL